MLLVVVRRWLRGEGASGRRERRGVKGLCCDMTMIMRDDEGWK